MEDGVSRQAALVGEAEVLRLGVLVVPSPDPGSRAFPTGFSPHSPPPFHHHLCAKPFLSLSCVPSGRLFSG